ncbi:hypothetical protein CVD28_04025 [Bacillus sp. M6-12]|uniref:hypothetical protein n=1 Tax=Bacillus sp. M6-12 TaxID=2054166 RepID=UPI000C76B23D|nr:hypothetical protein [Bacillus sp. M6-12]PLS19593.1 hypothetical protein CVD28_04025 [Bacillus sp. M6-12]
MLTKILKNDDHFISCNSSYSRFEYKDKEKNYTIRIGKTFNVFKDIPVSLEFPESIIWETPLWFRELVKKVEDAYYEKYKDKYKEKRKNISLSMLLFLYSIIQEDVDEGYDMDNEFSIYLKGESILRKDIDFVTWKKEWKSSFPAFQNYLQQYGYKVKVVEENHYERYFEIYTVDNAS